MVGILLLTHAPLGHAFVEAAAHVFHGQLGQLEQLEAIDVWANQEPQEVRRLAQDAISRLDRGDGVLVLTDVVGGTPCNCTMSLCEPEHVEVIAGISLPMLLRALTYRHELLSLVAERAIAGAQTGAVRLGS
jgi:PTS system mannose-specific IIA component